MCTILFPQGEIQNEEFHMIPVGMVLDSKSALGLGPWSVTLARSYIEYDITPVEMNSIPFPFNDSAHLRAAPPSPNS